MSYIKYIIITVISITPLFYSHAQEFVYEKNPNHMKQTWLFSSEKEAKSFLKLKTKRGWEGNIETKLQYVDGKLLLFTDSTSEDKINKISEVLKRKKISNEVILHNGRYFIKLGLFYEPNILNLRQKKFFSKKVIALRMEDLPSQFTEVYVLELLKPKRKNRGFFGGMKDDLKNFRYQFKYINEFAYNTNDPARWAKAKNYLHTNMLHSKKYNEYKISFRLLYDAAFDLEEDIYADNVKEDQQLNFIPNEIYWKHFNNNWYLQLGYINAKWGNLIDTYVADIIGPKDTRDFILPRNENIDMPFLGLKFNLHIDPSDLEVVWLPTPSLNKSGRYGSEFFPVQASQHAPNLLTDSHPEDVSDDMGYGLRLNTQGKSVGGSVFYFKSVNREPRYIRTFIPATPDNIASLKENHYQIEQFGGTFDLSIKKFQLHLEAVFTQNDQVPTVLANDIDGLVTKNNLHFGAQIKPHLFSKTDITLQYVVKAYADYTEDLMVDENEQFASIDLQKYFYNSPYSAKVTAHFGTQRGDSLIRPQFHWQPLAQLNFKLGYDLFEGDSEGLFGRYNEADRYYIETEYLF